MHGCSGRNGIAAAARLGPSLPGVMPLFSPARLARRLVGGPTPVLNQVREHNPLLFDLVLKRRLRLAGAAGPTLPASVFEGAAWRAVSNAAA
jgi:hypothetical protein